MMPLTPEWTVAIIAIGGIVFQTGFMVSKLEYLSKNAATKEDLHLLQAAMNSKEEKDQELFDDVSIVKKQVADLRVNFASLLAEVRAKT